MTTSALGDATFPLRQLNSFVKQIDAVGVQSEIVAAPIATERHVIRSIYASTTASSTARLKIRNGVDGDYLVDVYLPALGCLQFLGYVAGDAGTALHAVVTGTIGAAVVITFGMEVHAGS